jgi:uncharacterized protein (UPF0218 family)
MGERPPRPAFEPGMPIADHLQLRLPEAVRVRLAAPFGPIFPPEEIAGRTAGSARIAAVGDVTAHEAVARNVKPHFIVVDFKTKRGEIPKDDVVRGYGDTVQRVRSPPGILTSTLYNGVRRAAKTNRTTRIEVDGEEDLAVLPAIMHLAPGATVLYGMPDRGLAAVIVDDESRRLAREFLEAFEVEWV